MCWDYSLLRIVVRTGIGPVVVLLHTTKWCYCRDRTACTLTQDDEVVADKGQSNRTDPKVGPSGVP